MVKRTKCKMRESKLFNRREDLMITGLAIGITAAVGLAGTSCKILYDKTQKEIKKVEGLQTALLALEHDKFKSAIDSDGGTSIEQLVFSMKYTYQITRLKRVLDGKEFTFKENGVYYKSKYIHYNFKNTVHTKKLYTGIIQPLTDMRDNPLTSQFYKSIDYHLTTLSSLSYKLSDDQWKEQIESAAEIISDMVKFVHKIDSKAQALSDKFEADRINSFLEGHNKALESEKLKMNLLLDEDKGE